VDDDPINRLSSVHKQGSQMADEDVKMSYEEIYQRLKGYNIT
jgi:hypothetical protein